MFCLLSPPVDCTAPSAHQHRIMLSYSSISLHSDASVAVDRGGVAGWHGCKADVPTEMRAEQPLKSTGLLSRPNHSNGIVGARARCRPGQIPGSTHYHPRHPSERRLRSQTQTQSSGAESLAGRRPCYGETEPSTRAATVVPSASAANGRLSRASSVCAAPDVKDSLNVT